MATSYPGKYPRPPFPPNPTPPSPPPAPRPQPLAPSPGSQFSLRPAASNEMALRVLEHAFAHHPRSDEFLELLRAMLALAAPQHHEQIIGNAYQYWAAWNSAA